MVIRCVCPAPPPDPACANPEFTGPPGSPTAYSCEGRAGGALLYNQVVITVAGDPKGGPGVVQTDPAVTEFPGDGAEVSACCNGFDPVEDATVISENCQYDCGRAACNRVLASLRAQLEADDPSDGGCDPLPDSFEAECRERVHDSLQSWIDQIEANYTECVSAAVSNTNPDAGFTDHLTPFPAVGKLEFADNGCNHDVAGCLYGAELRPFCQIDSFSTESSCMAAGNPEDPAADGGGDADTTGGGGVADPPFGILSELIECSPQTSCAIDPQLIANVEASFSVFYDEGVVMPFGTFATGVTGLKITGLNTGEDSKALFDAFGLRNNDVITHVNGTALNSSAKIWTVIGGLEDASTWSIKVRRRASGSTYSTLNYSIVLMVAIEAVEPIPPLAATPGQSDDAGPLDPDDAVGSGCGCSAKTPRPWAWLLLPPLGAAVARRRRR